MKEVTLNITADLGIDCMYCGHSIDEGVTVMIEDKDADALKALAGELDGDVLEGSAIEENLPELYSALRGDAYRALHEAMVVQGWEEHGWDACSRYEDELIEEDVESGDFVFECPGEIDPEEDEDDYEAARQEAWEEAEDEKMGAMDTSELAEYLEERYGLDTDISSLDYTWSVSLQ